LATNPPLQRIRRKVFISYDSADTRAVEVFVEQWVDEERVFIPRFIGCFDEEIINSGDTDYVMVESGVNIWPTPQ
jgi:hypothetical protein